MRIFYQQPILFLSQIFKKKAFVMCIKNYNYHIHVQFSMNEIDYGGPEAKRTVKGGTEKNKKKTTTKKKQEKKMNLGLNMDNQDLTNEATFNESAKTKDQDEDFFVNKAATKNNIVTKYKAEESEQLRVQEKSDLKIKQEEKSEFNEISEKIEEQMVKIEEIDETKKSENFMNLEKQEKQKKNEEYKTETKENKIEETIYQIQERNEKVEQLNLDDDKILDINDKPLFKKTEKKTQNKKKAVKSTVMKSQIAEQDTNQQKEKHQFEAHQQQIQIEEQVQQLTEQKEMFQQNINSQSPYQIQSKDYHTGEQKALSNEEALNNHGNIKQQDIKEANQNEILTFEQQDINNQQVQENNHQSTQKSPKDKKNKKGEKKKTKKEKTPKTTKYQTSENLDDMIEGNDPVAQITQNNLAPEDYSDKPVQSYLHDQINEAAIENQIKKTDQKLEKEIQMIEENQNKKPTQEGLTFYLSKKDKQIGSNSSDDLIDNFEKIKSLKKQSLKTAHPKKQKVNLSEPKKKEQLEQMMQEEKIISEQVQEERQEQKFQKQDQPIMVEKIDDQQKQELKQQILQRSVNAFIQDQGRQEKHQKIKEVKNKSKIKKKKEDKLIKSLSNLQKQLDADQNMAMSEKQIFEQSEIQHKQPESKNIVESLNDEPKIQETAQQEINNKVPAIEIIEDKDISKKDNEFDQQIEELAQGNNNIIEEKKEEIDIMEDFGKTRLAQTKQKQSKNKKKKVTKKESKNSFEQEDVQIEEKTLEQVGHQIPIKDQTSTFSEQALLNHQMSMYEYKYANKNQMQTQKFPKIIPQNIIPTQINEEEISENKNEKSPQNVLETKIVEQENYPLNGDINGHIKVQQGELQKERQIDQNNQEEEKKKGIDKQQNTKSGQNDKITVENIEFEIIDQNTKELEDPSNNKKDIKNKKKQIKNKKQGKNKEKQPELQRSQCSKIQQDTGMPKEMPECQFHSNNQNENYKTEERVPIREENAQQNKIIITPSQSSKLEDLPPESAEQIKYNVQRGPNEQVEKKKKKKGKNTKIVMPQSDDFEEIQLQDLSASINKVSPLKETNERDYCDLQKLDMALQSENKPVIDIEEPQINKSPNNKTQKEQEQSKLLKKLEEDKIDKEIGLIEGNGNFIEKQTEKQQDNLQEQFFKKQELTKGNIKKEKKTNKNNLKKDKGLEKQSKSEKEDIMNSIEFTQKVMSPQKISPIELIPKNREQDSEKCLKIAQVSNSMDHQIVEKNEQKVQENPNSNSLILEEKKQRYDKCIEEDLKEKYLGQFKSPRIYESYQKQFHLDKIASRIHQANQEFEARIDTLLSKMIEFKQEMSNNFRQKEGRCC